MIGLVEAADEVDEGGLAGAALPDEADHLAGLDAEGDVLEDGLRLVVAERDVCELDLTADALDVDGVLVVVALGGSVDDLKDALGTGEGAAHPLIDVVEPLEWPIEQPEVSDERDDATEGHLAGDSG